MHVIGRTKVISAVNSNLRDQILFQFPLHCAIVVGSRKANIESLEIAGF